MEFKPYPPCEGKHRWCGYDEPELQNFVYCRCGAQGQYVNGKLEIREVKDD